AFWARRCPAELPGESTQHRQALHLRVDMQLRELLAQYWTAAVAALTRQLLNHMDQTVQAHELAHTAALVAQGRDGDTPTLVDFDQNMAFGHTYLIEKDLVELCIPGHLHQRPDSDTRALHLHQKAGNTPMLRNLRI